MFNNLIGLQSFTGSCESLGLRKEKMKNGKACTPHPPPATASVATILKPLERVPSGGHRVENVEFVPLF